MNLNTIAEEITQLDESIVLIYAFNGTGKTQLSVAYKNITKANNNGKHAGVYYNAYSEDLFSWDNDEENDGSDIKLNIFPSSLNRFHSFLYENEQAIKNELNPYNPKFCFRLNPYTDLEKGIESITFFKEGHENDPIKISRGEERIFVWCFFLALLEVDGWSNEQDAHIFIDDPVSSLDEHNIFITTNTLFSQIGQHYKNKRIIITTHHIGLFSILADRLKNDGRYKNLTDLRILRKEGDGLVLSKPGKNVFLYHLHLLQVLDEAIKNQPFTYHFAILRQLLENISSFQGDRAPGRVLGKLGIVQVDDVMNLINTHSHKTPYYFQTEMMSEVEREIFIQIFNALIQQYHFKF
ncbi:TPA: AAA family ATPase [Serratia marcescens]|nr:AAA family ATPase [Serratia marcescens]HEJ9108181.1 AAA family ATPase [Serratia marcescens]